MNGRTARFGRFRLPVDLAAVVGLVVITDLVLLLDVGLPNLHLRAWFGLPILGWLLGIPMLVFLPGYAVISAMYPTAAEAEWRGPAAGSLPALDRVMLSIVTSLVVVPAVAILVLLGPWTISVLPVLAALSAVTLGATWVAARRRRAVNPAQRFSVEWPARPRGGWFGGSTGGRSVPAGPLLVVSLLLLGAVSLSFLAIPPGGEGFSEAALLAENDGGQYVASALPTTFAQGEGQTIAVAIQNHEGSTTEYAVVVRLQRIAVAEDGTQRITEQDRLDSFEATLDDGQRTVIERPVRPSLVGPNLRLQYLVFAGGSPDSPSAEDADLVLRLWIEVN